MPSSFLSQEYLIILALSFSLCLIFTLVLGSYIIPFYKRKQACQNVRDEGPKSHLKKNGTPSFGGLMFMIPIILILSFFLIWGKLQTTIFIPFIFGMLGLGIVGYIDDYTKIRIDKEGLAPRVKTILQLFFLVPICIYIVWIGKEIPFFFPWRLGEIYFIEGSLAYLYAFLLLCYFYFFINAVNYTDGVDGLVSSVSISIFIPLVFAAYFFAEKYKASQIADMQGIVLIIVLFCAGLLGFLYYNSHPARIFMGDFGSLALGISVSLIPVYLGVPWLMLIIGLVYFVEALSSLLQVGYYKYSGGKRIFKMAPIHHHFELSGWSEKKIVVIFSLVALLSSLIGSLFYIFFII